MVYLNSRFMSSKSSKVGIQSDPEESLKSRLICGCLPASKWLEMIASIQIMMCMVQIVILSCTPLDWSSDKINTDKKMVDTFRGHGILPHQRPWTNSYTRAWRVTSVICSFISILMCALLLRAITKRLMDVLYFWILWLSLKIVASLLSSCILYQVNWFLILLVAGQNGINLFEMFLIFTLTQEIILEEELLRGSQKCCDDHHEKV